MFIGNRKIVKEVEVDGYIEVTFDDKGKETYTKKSINVIKTKGAIDHAEFSNLWSDALTKDLSKVMKNLNISDMVDNIRTTGKMSECMDKVQTDLLTIILEYGATIAITQKSLTTLNDLYNVIIKKVTEGLQFSINQAIFNPFGVMYQDEISLLKIDKILKK